MYMREWKRENVDLTYFVRQGINHLSYDVAPLWEKKFNIFMEYC